MRLYEGIYACNGFFIGFKRDIIGISASYGLIRLLQGEGGSRWAAMNYGSALLTIKVPI